MDYRSRVVVPAITEESGPADPVLTFNLLREKVSALPAAERAECVEEIIDYLNNVTGRGPFRRWMEAMHLVEQNHVEKAIDLLYDMKKQGNEEIKHEAIRNLKELLN